MLPADSLIDELPPAGRLLLGGVCCLGSALLGFAAWHAGDSLLIVLALGCGVPLGLIGLALLLGPARAERGRARRAVGADGGGTDGAGLAASVKALLLGIGLALGLAPCPLAAAPVLEPARSLLEQPYGEHPAQRFDVYLPARAERAPILLIVHGGGWAQGDKAARGLMRNKLKRWLPRDLILVSSNYRLLDQGGDPHSQAEDLARALAEVQRQAAAWGGDPQRVVLIGHSAGAHLVSLLASDPRLAAAAGARPWLGSIALDSAAFDVEAIMRGSPLRLYQRAFGNDPAY